MHIWVQVSRTGETLPLKTGTAVRDDGADRSVEMGGRKITFLDVRFIDLWQKMHGFVGMACAPESVSSKIRIQRSFSNKYARN
jgi:hypothetical protein